MTRGDDARRKSPRSRTGISPAQAGTTSSFDSSGPVLPADDYLKRPGDEATNLASRRRTFPRTDDAS
jgi:hypothetical protein